MRNEIPFPFWCRDVYQEVRTDHNEISTRTECEMMWRPKNIFGRKLNDLGWVCHERWAKSQSQNQSPITLTRYKESRSPKQINATCQQKMIFRSLWVCVRVCGVLLSFLLSPFRLIPSTQPICRSALNVILIRGQQIEEFFSTCSFIFFCSRTHRTVVWCILVVATDTFSYLLSLCSFQFWPFLCDTHTLLFGY